MIILTKDHLERIKLSLEIISLTHKLKKQGVILPNGILNIVEKIYEKNETI